MKKRISALLAGILLVFCLTACGVLTENIPDALGQNQEQSDVQNDPKTAENAALDNNDEQKQAEETKKEKEAAKKEKVIQIALELVDRYGKWLSSFTDLRAAEIIATDGNRYMVCLAYDNIAKKAEHPNQYYSCPTEVIVLFSVDSFYYDIDDQLRAAFRYDAEDYILFKEEGKTFLCEEFSRLQLFAKTNDWWDFSENHIVQGGIDNIVSSATIIPSDVEEDEPMLPANNGEASEPEIKPMYMWQGRDVFADFYAECFSEEETLGWEHLGINGDYFVLPGADSPTWVDVYRVYANDGSSDCYYVIPYGEIQLTEAYKSVNGRDTVLVWSVPLNEYYEWMN